jgi:hypothetical protein
MKTVKDFYLDKEGFVPEDLCLGEANARAKVRVTIEILEKPEATVKVIEKLFTSYDPRGISLYRLEDNSLKWVFDKIAIMAAE